MSRSVLEELKGFDPKKPAIYCPHPVYDNFGKAVSKAEARKQLGLNPEEKILLFFGFIRDYKGLDLAFRALATSPLKDMPVKLLVAGEFYTDAAPYHDLIRELDISDKVILHTDFIPDSAVYKYFCAADLVVQPYKHATQSGVSQIAFHFEKPMVITNVGGLAEFVPDGKAGYVAEREPAAIATAIFRYFSEEKEADFVEQVRVEKKKYEWSVMLKEVLKAGGLKPETL